MESNVVQLLVAKNTIEEACLTMFYTAKNEKVKAMAGVMLLEDGNVQFF